MVQLRRSQVQLQMQRPGSQKILEMEALLAKRLLALFHYRRPLPPLPAAFAPGLNKQPKQNSKADQSLQS